MQTIFPDQPVIKTREQHIENIANNNAQFGIPLSDAQRQHLHNTTPDFMITYRIGSSDSCSGEVTIHLYDTSDEDDATYDAEISTCNDDNRSLRQQAEMVQIAVDHFYANYATAFGRLIGD